MNTENNVQITNIEAKEPDAPATPVAEVTETLAQGIETVRPAETAEKAKKSRSRGRPRKAPAEKDAPEISEDDAAIGNDLYNLYVESFSHFKDDATAIDVFEAIEENGDADYGELFPNTADYDSDENDQIAFSDDFDDFEETDQSDLSFQDEVDSLPPYDEKKPRRIDNRFDFAELFIFTLLAVMILTSFIFRHSIVEGDSMQNTLHDGEHLIISDVFYVPQRGDIIVCEDYSTGIKKPIVKRIIAVGGDNLSITRDGEIYVNGELLDEEYVFTDGYARYPSINVTVPDGTIYVMGDHRNESTDSRSVGFIDEDAILGKVLLRFYPFNKFGTVD